VETEKEKLPINEISAFESTEQGKAFTGYLKSKRVKLTEAFDHFLKNMSVEAAETKEAAKLLQKYAQTGQLSEEEGEAFRKQMYDILKMLGIGIPFFIIPGASIILPILIKLADKMDIHLLPSAFDSEEETEKKEENLESKNDFPGLEEKQ
jgi:LETM1-like protein